MEVIVAPETVSIPAAFPVEVNFSRIDFIAGFAKSVSSSFRISVEVIFPSFTENAISIAPFLPSALPENVPSGRAFGFEQAAITAIEIPDATIKTAAASEFRRFLCFIYSSEKFFAD